MCEEAHGHTGFTLAAQRQLAFDSFLHPSPPLSLVLDSRLVGYRQLAAQKACCCLPLLRMLWFPKAKANGRKEP